MKSVKNGARLLYIGITLITSGTLVLLILAFCSIKNIEKTTNAVEKKTDHNIITLKVMQRRDSIEHRQDSIKYTKLLNIVNNNVTILSNINTK